MAGFSLSISSKGVCYLLWFISRFCWWLVDKLQRPSEVWKVTTLRKRSGTSWLRCRHGDVDVVRISSTDLLFPLKWRASAAAFYHFDVLVSLFYRTKKLYPLVILKVLLRDQRNDELEISRGKKYMYIHC